MSPTKNASTNKNDLYSQVRGALNFDYAAGEELDQVCGDLDSSPLGNVERTCSARGIGFSIRGTHHRCGYLSEREHTRRQTLNRSRWQISAEFTEPYGLYVAASDGEGKHIRVRRRQCMTWPLGTEHGGSKKDVEHGLHKSPLSPLSKAEPRPPTFLRKYEQILR